VAVFCHRFGDSLYNPWVVCEAEVVIAAKDGFLPAVDLYSGALGRVDTDRLAQAVGLFKLIEAALCKFELVHCLFQLNCGAVFTILYTGAPPGDSRKYKCKNAMWAGLWAFMTETTVARVISSDTSPCRR